MWICCVILALSVLPAVAELVDPAHEASISVFYNLEDGVSAEGAVFRFYRIASVDENGTYTLTDAFAGYPVEVNGLDSRGWRYLAETLAAYVARDDIAPTIQGVIDSNSHMGIPEDGKSLKTGLYLMLGDPLTVKNVTYIPEATLVSVPYAGIDNPWEYNVQVIPKYEMIETKTVSREVIKVWRDNNNVQNRPLLVKVQLLCNGEPYDTVQLSPTNNWSHTWTGLDASCDWRVVELEVPEGYTVVIDREGISFVVVNYSDTPEPPPPELPKTGLLWWPVPVLAVAGMTLFFAGWLIQRRNERDE